MKKFSILLSPVVFLLILFIKQSYDSADSHHIFHHENTNDRIIENNHDIINTESVNKAGFRNFLKVKSERVFSIICHQDHSRLLLINNEMMPLCPRCMGLHAGFFVVVCILMVFTRNRIRICGGLSLYLLIALLSLTGIEWSLEQLSIIRSTAFSRLLTGLLTGSVLGILLIAYKRGFILPASSKYQLINVPLITSIITVLLSGTAIVMLFDSWLMIDIILLISVAANFIIIIHTIILRFTPFMRFLIINKITP